MIRLNPVTDVVDSVKRGLVAMITDIERELASDDFKEILTTNATTEEGENKVAEYFKVEAAWELLLKKMAKQQPKSYWFQAILRALISCEIKK